MPRPSPSLCISRWPTKSLTFGTKTKTLQNLYLGMHQIENLWPKPNKNQTLGRIPNVVKFFIIFFFLNIAQIKYIFRHDFQRK